MKRFAIPICAAMLVATPVLADMAAGQKAFDQGNYRAAYAEWESAARQGDGEAHYRLGELYRVGMGVPQNYIQAHVHFNLAGALGFEGASEARDAIEQKLPADQVLHAQTLASEWLLEQSAEERGDKPQPAAADQSAPAAADLPSQAEVSVDAETDAKTDAVASISWSGRSSASAAVDSADRAQVKALIEDGIDPNHRLPGGDTLLLRAVKNADITIVSYLLEAGADPNLLDREGWSPLKSAMYSGNVPIARLLVRRGADTSSTSPDGMTALALAQHLGQVDLMIELERRGSL